MSDPQSNRKADRFRSAPRQEKIKPVAASRDVPGEMSSAFGRGNVVAEIVRFPSAEKKRTGLGPHPGKRKTKQVAVPRDRQKKTLCTLRSAFRGIGKPGTYNCRLKKRTGLGPHPTLEKPQFWPLFRGMSGVLNLSSWLSLRMAMVDSPHLPRVIERPTSRSRAGSAA